MDMGATIVVYIFSSLNKKRILIGSSLIFGTSQKRRPEPDFKKVIFLLTVDSWQLNLTERSC